MQRASNGGPVATSRPEGMGLRRVLLASVVGTTIEWYDFFLFGTAAALVFNDLFFPDVDPFIGTLASFATFAAGFVARPIGGVIFGHFGDRAGRKKALIVSLVVMGIGTTLIGFLPTYDTIGYAAPVLLLLLRLVQGIGLGGEWGGASLMALENAPEGRRGLWGSFPALGPPAGLLLSTGIFALLSTLPEDAFNAWGWRVPFLLSAALVVFGLVVRSKIDETPTFKQVEAAGEQSRQPVLEALREHPRDILLTIGMRLSENVCFYGVTVFGLSYATDELGLAKNTIFIPLMVSSALSFVTVPLFGRLSDRIGRKPVFLAGCLIVAVAAFPFFALVNTGAWIFIALALLLMINIGHDLTASIESSFFSELIGSKVRYSGASLGFQIGGALGGGFSPLIGAALLHAAGGAPWLVATYLVVVGLISAVSTLFVAETVRRDLAFDVPPAKREGAVTAMRELPTTGAQVAVER